jgi:hypothetical protein
VNGVEVHVSPGQTVYVVTSPVGDCVSTFSSDERFERGLENGKWDDSFVYRLSVAKGLELVNQPMIHGEYVA